MYVYLLQDPTKSTDLYSNWVLYEAASNILRCWVYSQYIQEPTSVVSCIQIWCYMRHHLTPRNVEYPLYIQEPTHSTEQYSNWVLVLVLVLYEAASDSRSTCLVCGFQTERRQRGEGRVRPRNNLFFRTCLLPRHTKYSSFVWKSDTERRQRGEGEGPPKKQLVLSHLPVA